MGVTVSSPLQISPLSLVSTVFGFVGFAFTVGTFVKVVWLNLETAWEASHQVHGYLNTIRQELVEEKTNLRVLRKQGKKRARWRERHPGRGDTGLGSVRSLELDEVSLKTMSDLIRHLMKEFRGIEKPFLVNGEDGILADMKHRRPPRRASSVSPYYEHSAYAGSPPLPEKGPRGRSASRMDYGDYDDDAFWAQKVHYTNLTLGLRLKWIWTKPKAQSLVSELSQVQTRRMSQQVAGIALLLHEHGNIIMHMEERVERIDDRVARVIGVRRVD